MNRIGTLFALCCLAISMASGCDGGAGADIPAAPVQLTPEQAAAIKQQDSQIDEEEGGAAKQSKPTKKGGARR